MKDTKLPNGMLLPKNTLVAVSSIVMWSAKFYKDPRVFDGFRFLKKGQAEGRGSTAQLASTSHEHFAFGIGKSLCPGRFLRCERD